MRNLLIAAAALIAVALGSAACNAWTPQQRSDAVAVVDEMERTGQITPAQGIAMREAIDRMAEGTTVEDVLAWVGGALGTVLASIAGVRAIRGPSRPKGPARDPLLLAQVMTDAERVRRNREQELAGEG